MRIEKRVFPCVESLVKWSRVVVAVTCALLACSSCSWIHDLGRTALVLEFSESASEISISVARAKRDGAIGGISIQGAGLAFDPEIIVLTGIYGSNGFSILSHRFDNVAGTATVVAVNAVDGIRNGTIATIEFTRIAEGEPNLELDPDAVVLVSVHNILLSGYDVCND